MSAAAPPGVFQPPPVTVEPSPRWVRVQLGGETVADSRHALLLVRYGPDGLPTYFFPMDDVRSDRLTPAGERDGRRFWTVEAGGRTAVEAAWAYVDADEAHAPLAGHVTFEWPAMDRWFEEDEEVFVHARDPHHRVDVMPSSRHVRVSIDGETVADTHHPFLLFETNLPVRYYLPPDDVRMERLTPTTTATHCPYKGVARYWSVQTAGRLLSDVAWSYPDPIPENPKIEGLICFFNEKVDIEVDGERQERPWTPWSE